MRHIQTLINTFQGSVWYKEGGILVLILPVKYVFFLLLFKKEIFPEENQ